MWITSKIDEGSQKDILFNELHTECRLSAPGARLSYSLRNRLERLPEQERKELVSRQREGCAPLFVACKRGNVEIVEYLLAECKADIEQKGIYEVPDDRSMHYVSPLWCAAVSGRLSVLRCLVKYGADVNSVSDSGSTPARSACYMTNVDVVGFLIESGADIRKCNHNGGTCLINSVQSVPLCTLLLTHGADVNAQDLQGKTALHYAIQEHRFETTKLLLSHGADPFITSIYGDDALQTACLKVAVRIFDYLISNFKYSKQRLAQAYELIGSTFLDEHYEMSTALQYWREALALRWSPAGEYVLPKLNKVEAKKAYMYMLEFETPDELNNLSIDYDAIRVQSLLVCERILGRTHKDMIFRLMFRGASHADSLHYQRCIDLWCYALELRIMQDGFLHTETCFAIQALVRLYLDLLDRHASGLLRETLKFEDVFEIVNLIIEHLPASMAALNVRPVFKKQQDNFDQILKVITHLLYLLNAIEKTAQQTAELGEIVNRLHRINPRTSTGDTLLHLVVSKANTMKSPTFIEDAGFDLFPNYGVTRLLLECGADVDAVNGNLSTPLNVASTRSNFKYDIVNLLLARGAHIDHRNVNGNQPYKQLAGISECTINPLNFTTLKCLAARRIIESRVKYRSGEIPSVLEDFLRIH